MTSRCSLPTRPLLCAGLLYLALPMFLFLGGWLHPAFSAPLCAAVAYGLYATVRNLPEGRLPLTRRGLAGLALLSFFCLLLTLMCGFTGHFQQHADFVVRNAVYSQLIEGSWPPVLPDGHHFIYYMGHWLPPSLAASFSPPSCAPWLLALWTFLGLELALLAAAVRWGIRKTALWALILFCLGSPAAALEATGLPLSCITAEYNAQMVLFIGIPAQIFNTFNHAVPALLCSALVLTRSLPPAGYYLMGALLLPSSPLAALMLFPYMLYETLFRTTSPDNGVRGRTLHLLRQSGWWAALACVAVMALFYAYLDGGGQFSCLFSNPYAAAYHYEQQRILLYPDSVKYISFLAALFTGVLLPGLLLFPACRRNPLYYITLGGMASCLFFRTGIMNNELLFKAPAVFYPFLALLFLETFRNSGSRLRIILLLYLAWTAIPSLACTGEKLGTFSASHGIMREHRQERYGGTLYHPKEPAYRQFIKKDGHPLPAWLFKTGTRPQHPGDGRNQSSLMPNMSDREPASLSRESSPPGAEAGASGIKAAASIPRKVNSSSGCSSSITPKAYKAAAACLHKSAQSGQEQEKRHSSGPGNRPPSGSQRIFISSGDRFPFNKSIQEPICPAHRARSRASTSSSGGAASTHTSYKCSPITSASMRPGAAFTSRTQP